MKNLILLVVLGVGTFILGTTSEAKADHFNSCGPSFGGGGYYGGYSPGFYSRSYYAPVYSYGYGSVNNFGYAYPRSGFYYGSPGFSISIGSGGRGFGTGGRGFGYGSGWNSGHRHHHH